MSALPKIRGRVWSVPPRGRLRRRCWHYEVMCNGVVVNEDDTCDFRTILDGCNRAVAAAREVTAAGQVLRPWDELVEEAGADL